MILFILRRDLRIEDNTTLIEALKTKQKIALIFIFNESLDKNYFSEKGNDYLKNRLNILSKEVNINFYTSKNEIEVLKQIIDKNKIEGIYFNSGVTDFANKRDEKIKNLCKKENINCVSFNDYLLFNPTKTLNKSGNCFKTFKSFWDFNFPKLKNITSNTTKINKEVFVKLNNDNWKPDEGNNYSLPITRKVVFEKIDKSLTDNYDLNRNYIFYETSKIFAALKFGVISCRELITYALNKKDSLSFIRQFLWKEFYYHFYLLNKRTYTLRGKHPSNIKGEFDDWVWTKNDEWVERWKNGQTGIPLIDAAMTELNETGFMHNRTRMIVASFFCKNLNLDWRIGEKYFATKLIDYDPIVNNQSWQWMCFTGLDLRGTYRVFF